MCGYICTHCIYLDTDEKWKRRRRKWKTLIPNSLEDRVESFGFLCDESRQDEKKKFIDFLTLYYMVHCKFVVVGQKSILWTVFTINWQKCSASIGTNVKGLKFKYLVKESWRKRFRKSVEYFLRDQKSILSVPKRS